MNGIRPVGCDALESIAQTVDPRARVWRGSGETDLPPSQQGIVVLGNTPNSSRRERIPMVGGSATILADSLALRISQGELPFAGGGASIGVCICSGT